MPFSFFSTQRRRFCALSTPLRRPPHGVAPGIVVVLLALSFTATAARSQDASEEESIPSSTSAPAETSAPTAAQDAIAAEAPGLEYNDGDPQWLQKLLTRTGEPPALRQVASEDGFFKARIPAEPLKPMQPFDGGYFMTLQFGAGDDGIMGECYVYEESFDMAAFLATLSDSIFELIESTYGSLESKQVQGVDGGNFASVPFLGLAWLYRTQAEKLEDSVVGQVKHWVAIKQGHGIYCQSTVMGYDDLLFGLFRSLTESIEFSEPQASQPYYEEVSQISVGEQLVGISHLTYRIDQDGDIETREATSMLVPLDQQTLMTSDSVSVHYSTLDGEVISEMEFTSENGELVTELRLDDVDEDGWTVTGTFQGKPLQAALGEGEGLRSSFGERLDFVEFLKTAEPSSVMSNLAWEAGFDPTQLVESSVTYLAPQPGDGDALHHRVKLALGPLQLDGVVDEGFSVVTADLQMGAVRLNIERLHAEGDIWHPRSLPAFAEAMAARGRRPELSAEAAPDRQAGDLAEPLTDDGTLRP